MQQDSMLLRFLKKEKKISEEDSVKVVGNNLSLIVCMY
jgi:hypothetical protein